jgi:FAD/FMN-containing dehydrogenase/Fe-S oxidoreductase
MDSIRNDLERLISGEVFTDPVNREAYSTAAGIYRILPRAVIWPKDQADVAAVVRYAAQRGVTVTARGAGSGVAGQAIGPGIIIDLQKHMNKILAVNYESGEAIVQPGLILAELNRELAPYNLKFPPDPSSGDYATIGGMIANNSSGAHSLKYGPTRAWTEKVKAVLADGSVTWLEPKPALPQSMIKSDVLENRIYAGLPRLLKKHADAVERSRPRVSKNSSGYHVWDLIKENLLNPTPLIVGSEGTLAIVVKAFLKLAPVPDARAAALLCFESIERACDAAPALGSLEPSALEIMDRMFMETVREHRPELRRFLPEDAGAVLFIEFEARDRDEAGRLLDRAGEVYKNFQPRGPEMIFAGSEAEINELTAVRNAASPILYRLPGKRLTRFIEDFVVPPERLGEGIGKVREILRKYGTEAPVIGHAGSGNLHMNPRLNLEDPEDRKAMKEIADEIYSAVIEMGGSITGEHGDGMLRAPYVKRQFPELAPLFTEIKELFDPSGILNPGKILSDAGSVPPEMLRFGEPGGDAGCYECLHVAGRREMLLRCHGCGLCRTYCPVTSATGEELSLPRSKVSVLRAVALGLLDPEAREARDEFQRLLQLCTGCQRCVTGCPTGIEPYLLIREFMNEDLKRRGRPLREHIFAKGPEYMSIASRMPELAAKITTNRPGRALLQSVLGIRKDAPFPRPSRDALAGRDKAEKPGGRTALFYPGCLGRYADTEGETKAALEILNGLGLNVIAPDLPCCGQPRLMAADTGGAMRLAKELTAALEEYLPEGIPLITACPACALSFKHDFPAMLHDKARRVSGQAREFMEFLSVEVYERELNLKRPSFKKVIVHRPCHQAASSQSYYTLEILGRLEGIELIEVDTCCGLAGAHGMRIENAPVSDALASKFTDAARQAGTGRVISSCPACRTQIRRLGLEPISAVAFLGELIEKS